MAGVLIAGLGPGTAANNLRLLQDATRGAALVFSSENMRRAAAEILSIRALAGWLAPALIWTGIRQFARDGGGQRWGAIWWMAVANLGWYVLASAGWPRYAFPGLALSCLFVGRFAYDLAHEFDKTPAVTVAAGRLGITSSRVSRLAVTFWVVAVSLAFLGRTTLTILRAPYPPSQRMAAFLDANVPKDRVIHTWEPEMSILSEHRFRFPPPQLLIVAVAHQWTGGPPVTQSFDFERGGKPDYVLDGPFSRYVELYPRDRLDQDYRPVTTEGGYVLYERRTAERRSAEDRSRDKHTARTP